MNNEKALGIAKALERVCKNAYFNRAINVEIPANIQRVLVH